MPLVINCYKLGRHRFKERNFHR